ncbi:MAG: hypothetical protein HQM08_08425 [Candidatus Riflebacteria bacterium]|nr:hypothetical protein [Candidatus Riflebacteria bacterium]
MEDCHSFNDLYKKLVKEEDRKVVFLQGIVDTAILKIMNSKMSRSEALNLVLKVRAVACELFPESVQTFDLVFMNRFKRVIDEYIPE